MWSGVRQPPSPASNARMLWFMNQAPPLYCSPKSQERPMSNEIDQDRRGLVGARRLDLCRQPVRVQRRSRSPAIKTEAGESWANQAGYAYIVRAAEADRRRSAQYRLCRSRSGGRAGGDPAARMAVRHLQL